MVPTASLPPRICLNMIVKNEAPVIERCLASVRPWVDYWVIVDTGSTRWHAGPGAQGDGGYARRAARTPLEGL